MVVSPWFFESWKAVVVDAVVVDAVADAVVVDAVADAVVADAVVVDAVADAVVEEDGEVGVDEVPHRHYHLLDP